MVVVCSALTDSDGKIKHTVKAPLNYTKDARQGARVIYRVYGLGAKRPQCTHYCNRENKLTKPK